jgi:hypothetical protein
MLPNRDDHHLELGLKTVFIQENLIDLGLELANIDPDSISLRLYLLLMVVEVCINHVHLFIQLFLSLCQLS